MKKFFHTQLPSMYTATSHTGIKSQPKINKQIMEMLADAPVAIVLFDTKWQFVYLNKEGEKLFGSTNEALKGKNLFTTFPQALKSVLVKKAQQAVAAQKPCRFREFTSLFDKWLEVSYFPSKDGISFYVTDVTEKINEEQKQKYLNKLNEILVSPLDNEFILQQIAKLLVPELADYCRIVTIDESGQISEIMVNHKNPKKVSVAIDLYNEYKDLPNLSYGVGNILKSGKSEIISQINQQMLRKLHTEASLMPTIKSLGLRSYIGVPLLARGKTIGAITFSSVKRDRYYTHQDMLFAQDIAHRIALRIDNTRLYNKAEDERRRFRALIENSADGIRVIDVKGNIIYASPSTTKILGYSIKDYMQRNILNLIHPEDRNGYKHVLQKIINNPTKPFAFTYRILHKDGKYRWIEGIGRSLLEDSSVKGIISNFRDITQRKAAEERLQQSETLYRTVVENN